MEDWSDIPLQGAPGGISDIGQTLEHGFCSSGQTYFPEKAGVHNAFKMQTLGFFTVTFVPEWDFSQ